MMLVACFKTYENEEIFLDHDSLIFPERVSYKYIEAQGERTEKVKNFLFQKTFEFECSHLLLVSASVIPENDALIKLWNTMQNNNALVVTANYSKPNRPVSAHGRLYGENTDYLKYTDMCAMDFVLINTYETSKMIPDPYFWKLSAPDGVYEMTEDLFFTKKMAEYAKDHPLVDLRPGVLYHDRSSGYLYGKINEDSVYAGDINKFFV